MRPMMTFAVTGVVALVLLKLLAAIALPVLGVTLGLAALLFKVLLIGAVVACAVWVFRRLSRSPV